MLESVYQARLIKKLYRLFPGCVILKNDTDYQQGIPDLLVLFCDRWAMLEVKVDASAPFQPNQEYYLDLLDTMSFAAVIHPGNEEEVLSALQLSFEFVRDSRVSQS